LARTREVEDVRVDAQDRRQVMQLAADVIGHLLGDRELVVLDGAAQRALADAQGGVARDREGNRRDPEREERELREQLHGGGSKVNASVRTESPPMSSCARRLMTPEPGASVMT